MLCYAALLVLPPAAWWDSRYVVPALGVVLGGAIGSVGAGLSALMDELMTGGCTKFPPSSRGVAAALLQINPKFVLVR